MDENYQGPHRASFNRLRNEIPVLMRQTLIDLSVRLGLDFRDGWKYPLTIGFVDQAPWGVENVLAYVQLYRTEDHFGQVLNINLASYNKEQFNFEKVLAHELTHAMINDAIGGQAAMVLPRWFHEGLAVYGAEQGDQMLKSYVYQTSGFSSSQLLNGLEIHDSAFDYAEDFLAFKYIYKKRGQASLHNFVQEVLKREGDVPGAIEYICLESWDEFQASVREFSKEEIKDIGPRRRGSYEKPY